MERFTRKLDASTTEIRKIHMRDISKKKESPERMRLTPADMRERREARTDTPSGKNNVTTDVHREQEGKSTLTLNKSDVRQLFENKFKDISRVELPTSIDREVVDAPRRRLPKKYIDSFQDGKYRTVITQKELTVYRVFGGGTYKESWSDLVYLTTRPPADRLYEKMNSALTNHYEDLTQKGQINDASGSIGEASEKSDKFRPNTRKYYCEVKIPAGTEIHIGYVAHQKTIGNQELPGGGEQIVSPCKGLKYGETRELGYRKGFHSFSRRASELEKKHS